MPYAASCSRLADSRRALEDVCREVLPRFAGARPDLSFLFASRHHADAFDEIAVRAQSLIAAGHILGCTGESIAEDSHEFEDGPTLCLWCAVLAGADLEAFHV